MTEYKIQGGLVFTRKDNQDWEQVTFYPSPNGGQTIKPRYLIIHYTAGSGDAHQTASYFQKSSAKASAHLNMSVDGELTQCMGLEKKAWHAGKSSWAGLTNLNSHSIGIEVCNPGPLTITKKGYKSWFGKYYDDDGIVEGPHPNDPNGPVYGWLPFTPAQMTALVDLGQAIMEEYNLIEALGHDMISPGRKTDPGLCMDYRVYDMLNAPRDDDPEDEKGHAIFEWFVSARPHLNGRSGPGTTHPVIMKLEVGQEIDIIKRSGIWWFVETQSGQQCWVHSKFLRMQKLETRMKKDPL